MTTLASSFGIGSFFAGIEENHKIKPRKGSKIGKIGPWTKELVAPERHRLIIGECYDHSSAFNFGWIFFSLTGNKNNNKNFNKFEFRQDATTDYRVSCPWAFEKIWSIVTTLAPLFLIGSSSFLQVTRTTINLGWFQSYTRSDLPLRR